MPDPTARPILIAYDGSEHARVAIERAGALFGPRAAVVACVWSPVAPAAAAASIAAPRPLVYEGARALDIKERERAEGIARTGALLAADAGLAAEARAIRGDGAPWRALVDCAAAIDAEAVVAGTRGRSRAVSAVLGSTAAGILHHAHRPVLVVPA
ncbi:MAG TPA: universal stress protein [Solirubrobacteraceae bacterium]|nr:universal stress protein [Solirubrobacteraceae bacterium]